MSMKKGISLFTVSFKQGFMSPNIPIASFKQGDKDINFLLDTGSDNNIIDATALKQFEHEMYDEELVEKVNLTGVGGNQQVKACKLTFSCDGEDYTQNFLVADMCDALQISNTSFPRYKERLLKKGVIAIAGRGLVELSLPRFAEVVELYP